MVLLTSKEKHEVWFKDGEQFTNITYQSRYYDLLSNDYLFVKHKFLQKPDRYARARLSRSACCASKLVKTVVLFVFESVHLSEIGIESS